MTFAVGLREDAANAEYYVKKILPMSFYEPGKPVEKRARAPPKDAPPVEALDVPELVEMRQRLRDVLRGCEKMEREEKQCAAELQAATDRLATVEKRSAQLDDQRVELRRLVTTKAQMLDLGYAEMSHKSGRRLSNLLKLPEQAQALPPAASSEEHMAC